MKEYTFRNMEELKRFLEERKNWWAITIQKGLGNMLHKYNFISKSGCVTVFANCDANAVTKFKKKHPGETSVSATKEESTWTVVSNGEAWTLNVPAAKKGTCRQYMKVMKRI